MKKRTGAVAMKHAKAILERDYLVIQYSGKRIVRIPDQAEPGGFRIIALSEDLWNGCFDAIAAGAHVNLLRALAGLQFRFICVGQRNDRRAAGRLKHAEVPPAHPTQAYDADSDHRVYLPSRCRCA